MSIRQIFHKLIAYRFRNDQNKVRTAYLDTYFTKYVNKSSTYDYILHDKVMIQFAKNFIRYHDKPMFKRELVMRLFSDHLNDFIDAMNYYFGEVFKIINDYASGSSDPHIFINQILQKYNDTIYKLERIPQLPLRHIDASKIKFEFPVETKYQPPKPILSYSSRSPILTHRKGHRGFVRDYEYYHYW